jgi:molybdopterin synthase sulfur carrier subunit
MIRLIFLGRLAEIVPDDLATVKLPEAVGTLLQLKDWLAHRVPQLGQALRDVPTRFVVNHTLVHDLKTRIGDGDEIAFLPPMSGG